MKDKNLVILEGLVGEDLKRKKSTEGAGEYYTFTLCVNGGIGTDKWMSETTDREWYQTYVRCFIYDKHAIEYCDGVGMKKGQRVNVLGKLTSFRSEVKGKVLISLVVTIRDISVVKTKREKKEEQKE